ncbi:hypothetical protein MP638_003184 [Amoeboaphelidium occidentale]|nr:hypothetical protein MP638_003184 [Amoeboaphelidium occidentale]
MSSKKLVQVWYHLKQADGKEFSDITVSSVLLSSKALVDDLRKAVKADNADGLLKGISASQLKVFKHNANLVENPMEVDVLVSDLGEEGTTKARALKVLAPAAKKRKAVDEIIEDDDDEQDASTQKVVHVFEHLANKLKVNSSLMKRSCYEELRGILVSEKAEWDKKNDLNLSRGSTCEVYLTGSPGIGITAFLTWLIKTLLRCGYRVVFGCREFKGQWAEMRYTTSTNGKKHIEVDVLSRIYPDLKKDTKAWIICDSVEVPSFTGMAIFCSSPRENVSKQFRKRALELTMPVWT